MPTTPGASLIRSSSTSDASTSGKGRVAKPRTRSGLRLARATIESLRRRARSMRVLRLEHIDARRVHRQDRHVDALPVHLADQMVGIEHLRAERQPGLAVLEQVAEAVRIGLDRHARQRAQRVEENLLDLVGMNVDFHGATLRPLLVLPLAALDRCVSRPTRIQDADALQRRAFDLQPEGAHLPCRKGAAVRGHPARPRQEERAPDAGIPRRSIRTAWCRRWSTTATSSSIPA